MNVPIFLSLHTGRRGPVVSAWTPDFDPNVMLADGAPRPVTHQTRIPVAGRDVVEVAVEVITEHCLAVGLEPSYVSVTDDGPVVGTRRLTNVGNLVTSW